MPDLSKLFTCPRCDKPNFTRPGLRAHVCKKKRGSDGLGKRLTKDEWLAVVEPAPEQPLAVIPPERAVKEITLADLDVLPPVRTLAVPVSDFFQAKTYLQGLQAMGQGVAVLAVLLGTELMRLHKLHGVKRGRPAVNSQNGLGIKWEDRVQAELGISDQSAINYMKLAEQARKRLPEFGPIAEELLSTPLSLLSDSRRMELAERTRNILPSDQIQKLSWDWGISKKPKGYSSYDRSERGKGKTGITAAPPGEQALRILGDIIAELSKRWPQHWVHIPHHLLKEWDGNFMDMRKQIKKALGE